jgi:general secretion pathway protein J
MKSAGGFTLMEVLVALVLLTLFTLVTYRALDSVLEAQRRAGAEIERWREMAAAFVWLDSDLSNAVTRLDPRELTGSVFHTRTESDGAMQFDLVRLLPEDADAGLQKIGYRCEEKKLVRLVWPEVDNAAVAPKEFTLLQGLTACAFRYMNFTGQWLPTWFPLAKQPLPLAVELNFVEAGGSAVRRVWRVQ